MEKGIKNIQSTKRENYNMDLHRKKIKSIVDRIDNGVILRRIYIMIKELEKVS